jgi:hypothetical protein
MRPPLPRIDWVLLGKAVAFYASLGYKYVEVPYCVPHETIRLTLPAQYEPDYVAGLGCLVGSAEQSLLSLDLPDGSYMAVSPCFRPEPVLNAFYQRHFMKVELLQLGDDMNPIRMLHDARQFMTAFANLEVLTTAEGWDLTVGGVEVGSYGFREAGDRRWACGTGLALPRFDVARALVAIEALGLSAS